MASHVVKDLASIVVEDLASHVEDLTSLVAALVLLPLRSAEAKKEVSSTKGDGVTALSGADPADKKRLEDAAAIIDSLEESLQDPNKWQSVIDTVTKV